MISQLIDFIVFLGKLPYHILGLDFTSAPRRAKPITVAHGVLDASGCLHIEQVEALTDFAAFESVLHRPGPWLGGFDFPFGLPREAVTDLRLPTTWDGLVRHCASLGKPGFRALLDGHRQARPMGNRYAHRATDQPAGSHSPLKLVNPPVGLMFLEGAPRLLAAGCDVPGLHAGDPTRVALEAYPGLLARQLIGRTSYKSDDKARQTPARRAAREQLLAQLLHHEPATAKTPMGDSPSVPGQPALPALKLTPALHQRMLEDGSGDVLDAVLCALQAVSVAHLPRYGMPAQTDAVEGWIIGAQPA